MAKRQKTEIEVRRDPPTLACPEGEIDEICGHGQFHLERMSDQEFALMLYGEKGDVMCVWLTPKRKDSRRGGQRPHVRALVGWHDTAEERRRFSRDFKACMGDPLKYIETMKRRRRAEQNAAREAIRSSRQSDEPARSADAVARSVGISKG